MTIFKAFFKKKRRLSPEARMRRRIAKKLKHYKPVDGRADFDNAQKIAHGLNVDEVQAGDCPIDFY